MLYSIEIVTFIQKNLLLLHENVLDIQSKLIILQKNLLLLKENTYSWKILNILKIKFVRVN